MDIAFLVSILIALIFVVLIRRLKLIKHRPLLYWVAIFLVCFILLFCANEIFRRRIGGLAGSYPFVETWELKVKEDDLIKIIKELKNEKKDLQPPNQTALTEGRLSGFMENSPLMDEYKYEFKKDSTTKLPKHTEENSYGNAENGWTDYWYYIDFYYPDTKEIIHTWTRPGIDKNTTTFAFVSLSRIDDSTDFRFINRDFWYLSNRLEINKFEKTILQPIQNKLRKKSKFAGGGDKDKGSKYE